MFVGKNLITLKKVDSTNNYAKLLAANSGPLPDGTVILAEAQHGGRGQSGNSWVSEPGKNLTFSILFDCSFLRPPDQFFLSMAISLGLIDGLNPILGGNSAIKWPNDILLSTRERKLGGILIENLLAGNVIKTSVVGIGINVNQEIFPGLPDATSLRREKNTVFPLDALLTHLCQTVEARFLQLKGGARQALKEDYLRHLLGYGRKRLYYSGPAAEQMQETSFEGIITGVTHEGKLLIETEGVIRAFNKKEVSIK